MKNILMVSAFGCFMLAVACHPSKEQMKKEFIQSCIAEAKRAETAKDEKTKKAFEYYCECAGQKVIDSFTIAELEQLNKTPKNPELLKKLQPIIANCAAMLGKQLEQ